MQSTLNRAKLPGAVAATLLLLLAASFLVPVPAAAEETEAPIEQMRSRLIAAGYSEEERTELISMLRNARRRDIPPALVTPRIYEGAAKQVPVMRIVEVVEEEIALLARARTLLRSIPGTDTFLRQHSLWLRTAHLLEKEVDDDSLRHLIRISLPRPQLYRPVSGLFLSLTDWGLDAREARRVTEALAESSIPPEEFAGVPRLYKLARSQRISPEQLTGRIVRAAPSAGSLQELEKRTVRD